MDEKLNEIFSNINDWLKFAEAKSATLIAGNGALVFGVARLAKSYDLHGILALYCMIVVFLCLFSMIVCLISIIPSLVMPWDSKPIGVNGNDNLLYFHDIAKYTPSSYLEKVSEKLNLKNPEFTGYQKDLSRQIIINSVIARRKYNYFKFSIWLSLSALVTPVIGILIYLMGKW